jgi:alpha-D-ribose 1-methylphosphonate 5-triphosphate synthase subunit PhnH
MIRELAYDPVLHSQSHFRSILEAVSRPGTIRELEAVELAPAPGLDTASSLVAFALLNADVSFHLVNMSDVAAEYLSTNTNAAASSIEQAAFIFTDGAAPPAATLEGANCGTLNYPDTAATIVIQVEALSPDPLPGALMLTLEGPGVDGRSIVSVRGLSADLLLALQARNAEFPLGIDAIVTCDDGRARCPRVLGIPRTARVSWEAC